MSLRLARLAWALCGLAVAGLLSHVAAFELPATYQVGKMLHPGHYACLDGTTPTSEFDILDGTAYFLRGATLRAGEFGYDKVTGVITWKSGPFSDNSITGYNTMRSADRKPVIILRFSADSEAPSTEYCEIVE